MRWALSHRGWLGLVVAVVVLGGAVWIQAEDVPLVKNPFRSPVDIPSYLSASNPAVRDAFAPARSLGGAMERLSTSLLASAPDRSTLWVTQRSSGSEAAWDEWRAGRRVSFVTFPAWSVPEDPSWAEDPFGNISWQFYYQSLGWLQALDRGFQDTRDRDLQRVMAHYVLDWIQDSPRQKPPSSRSWYDHAVAYRTDTLVLLFPDIAPVLKVSQLQQLLRSLEQHGSVLHGYLADPAFFGHNHNLFHALSLYNLAVAFPELRGAQKWRTDARARVASLLGEMVDKSEGVSSEQAAGYHFLALRLFVQADRFLAGHGEELPPDVRAVLGRMVEFGAVLANPDGTLPAIGDTSYAARAPLDELRQFQESGLGTPVSAFLLSEGAAGERPHDLELYPNTGYAVMRPSYREAAPWKDDLHVVFDFGPARHNHGHADALNVVLSAGGGPVLVDPGGPYVYGKKAHADFVSARAHNVVVVDNDADSCGGATLLSSGDGDDAMFVSARCNDTSRVSQQRAVIVLKPELVLILDRLVSRDGKPHKFELYEHLPPGASIESRGSSVTIGTNSGGAALTLHSSPSADVDVIDNELEPRIGWVTTGYLKRTPARVLRTTTQARNAWFATLVTSAQSAPQIDLAGDTKDRIQVDVSEQHNSWRVTLDAAGMVSVSRLP